MVRDLMVLYRIVEMGLRGLVKHRVVLFLKTEVRVLLTKEIVALLKHILWQERLRRSGLVIQLRRFYHQIV